MYPVHVEGWYLGKRFMGLSDHFCVRGGCQFTGDYACLLLYCAETPPEKKLFTRGPTVAQQRKRPWLHLKPSVCRHV